ELYGGMKQRGALARALAPNPRMLLMDAPLAALDAITREQLYGDLQRIWKSRRKTIVFVTHNVREAVCLGDRVLLFSPHPGRVQEEFLIELPRPRDLNSVELATYASRIPTPSKAVPNPRLRQRNETIPPRLSLFRGLDRSLGMGFSGENLVAGLVAGSAASRGVSENIRHGWYSFSGYRHYHAPAADRLCHRPYWWVAARGINGPLESFPRYHRDARA